MSKYFNSEAGTLDQIIAWVSGFSGLFQLLTALMGLLLIVNLVRLTKAGFNISGGIGFFLLLVNPILPLAGAGILLALSLFGISFSELASIFIDNYRLTLTVISAMLAIWFAVMWFYLQYFLRPLAGLFCTLAIYVLAVNLLSLQNMLYASAAG